MPELPEVETVVRDLRLSLRSRRILAVRVGERALRRPWSPAWNEFLVGRSVRLIDRRGKWIAIHLTGGAFLVIHLGMTGQLTVTQADAPLQDHTHLIVSLDTNKQLRFRDIRRFGSAAVYEDADQLVSFLDASRLGPEPFQITPEEWRALFADTRRPLKAILLDQRGVAGVGNIYADEAFFEARLHPARLGCDLTGAEAARLGRAVVTVLNRAIEKRGSSIRNYVGGSGLRGGYQDEFRAYGRTGEPCRRCKTPIERIRLAGRSTHFCPQCQKKC